METVQQRPLFLLFFVGYDTIGGDTVFDSLFRCYC